MFFLKRSYFLFGYLFYKIQFINASFSSIKLSHVHFTRCTNLKSKVPKGIQDVVLEPYVSEIHAPGNFSTPLASSDYNTEVTNLPEFCRFGAYFNTSSTSRVQFEVWLPTEKWSGRMAFIGNNADSGGVNYPKMGIPLSKYKFAVVSTNTGHQGTLSDGTFAISNPETQYDFGYRAVHLSTVFSKVVIESFYNTPAKKNYWIGCSSGGKQGLKEVQLFPEDFDGVLAGAAAQWWTHLNGWTVESNLRNGLKIAGHLQPSHWELVYEYTLKECDLLDGVQDAIINNPLICKPNFNNLLCSSTQTAITASNKTSPTCLTAAQVSVANSLFIDWVDEDGKFLFPSYTHGSELFSPLFVTGVPYSVGPDFFKYQVLNFTNVNENYQFTSKKLLELLRIADQTNPGQTNAIDGNILPFIKRGGKLLTYVGMADPLIPTRASIWYHEQVKLTLGKDPRDSYRLFTVPGMGHCCSGPGPVNIGAAFQTELPLNETSQSYAFDSKHDMILALIKWTEKGIPPDEIIATKFNNDLKADGVKFQRKLCPWPLMGKYDGVGNPNSYMSYSCQEP